ncbi:MAG: antA/AntB antirepressor family protein [Acidithiobacillus sp.]
MEKQLIEVHQSVIGDELVASVNARDLHAFLGVGKVFRAWIQERIKQFDFVENQDFIVSSEIGRNSQGGRPSMEYVLTLDMAKELSMIERTPKGKEARQYFIACEKALHGLRDRAQSKPTEPETGERRRAPLPKGGFADPLEFVSFIARNYK